jgi:hypothetical protein
MPRLRDIPCKVAVFSQAVNEFHETAILFE